MSMVVDELIIKLGLDPKGIDKGIAQAQNKLTTGFKGFATKLFAPLTAGLSVGALFDSLQKELAQMNRMSKAYRVNIEDMTAWSRAVVQSGGNVEALEGSLNFLNMNLTRMAITGRSRVKPFFEAMGLDAQNLAKKPVLDALGEISLAVDKMDKRQATNLLRGMGFDAGTIKLLQSGSKNIKELIARQKELGVYTAKDAEALTKMTKGFREIISVLKSLLLPLFVKVIGVASKFTQYLVNGIVYIRKNVDILRGALLLLAAVFSKRLLQAVIQFGNAFLTNPFGMFIAGLTILILLLEDLWVYANKGKSAFGDIWKQLGDPDEVLAGFNKIGKAVGDFFKFIGNLFSGKGVSKELKFIALIAVAIATLAAAIGAIPVAIAIAGGFLIAYWDKIEALFSDVADWFADLGKRIRNYWGINGEVHKSLTAIWESIANTADEKIGAIKGVISAFGDAVLAVWNWIKETAVGMWESVNEAFDTAINYIISLWDGVVSAFDSGCSAIAGFLSNAANTARQAWAGFISWLEQKWEWLKGLLPTFSSIASKLPSLGNSAQLAVEGAGGGGGTTITNDNSKKEYKFYATTKQSSDAMMKKSGYVANANSGVK